MSENKGIIMSGGTINTEQLSVGDQAKSIKTTTDSSETEDPLRETNNPQRSQLARILADRFSEEELRSLCFHLGLDYEDLPASGKSNKARELAGLIYRHNLVSDLKKTGKEIRSDIDWDQF